MMQVAREHGRVLAPLDDQLALTDAGLDSLGWAVLLARLEERLKINPFLSNDSVLPRTFSDFINAFDHDAR